MTNRTGMFYQSMRRGVRPLKVTNPDDQGIISGQDLLKFVTASKEHDQLVLYPNSAIVYKQHYNMVRVGRLVWEIIDRMGNVPVGLVIGEE